MEIIPKRFKEAIKKDTIKNSHVFKCQRCENFYYSRKHTSKYCSKDCQYPNLTYQCDYCGITFPITQSKLDKLKNGTKKNLFCSKECYDQFQNKHISNICLNCGIEFSTFESIKDTNKFCSKECYQLYRSKNARINIARICPICNTIFYSGVNNAKYCSSKCSGIAQQDRIRTTCDYCGEEILRKKSDVSKAEKHYCNNICRILAMQWNEQDKDILRKYYHKIPTRELSKMLSTSYNSKQISSEAKKLGLTIDYSWSKQDVELLKSVYSNVPMSQVVSLFPAKTIFSIKYQAANLGLKSFYYLNSIYSESDDNFLKENYLNMTDNELALHLNRTISGIKQHLFKIGLKRPLDLTSVCYKNLAQYVRAQIAAWKNKVRADNNYTCFLTGSHSNIVVHHCRSFNLLLQEVIELLDFEIKEDFQKYKINELDELVETFLEVQDYYGEYVCITESVHRLFHNNYGYGNNTMDQWNEFVNNYQKNKYQKIA